MELKRRLRVISSVVRQDVQEGPDKVEILSCHVGHEEHGAYPLAHELSCRVYALLASLDESRNLARSRTLHDLGDLGYCLLENVGRANVDLGDNHHDRDIQSQSNSQMFFAHSDEAIIGCNHKQTIIRAAREQSENRSSEIPLVARQIGESDNFGASLPDLLPRELSCRLLLGELPS